MNLCNWASDKTTTTTFESMGPIFFLLSSSDDWNRQTAQDFKTIETLDLMTSSPVTTEAPFQFGTVTTATTTTTATTGAGKPKPTFKRTAPVSTGFAFDAANKVCGLKIAATLLWRLRSTDKSLIDL